MKYSVLFIILCFSLQGFSQSKFKHKVFIKGSACTGAERTTLIQKEKGEYEIYKTCEEEIQNTLVLPAGFNLTEMIDKGYNGVEFELKKESILKTDSIITYTSKEEKVAPFCLNNEIKKRYKANLSISQDSILINFWLLKKDGKTYYQANDLEKESFLFNPETKYFMTLDNRQYLSFHYRNYEIAALVIPFKYHFGYVEEDIAVDPVFNAEININTFAGIRLGRVAYTYDTYKGMIENQWSFTLGGFIGLGSQKLDSISTSTYETPLDHEINVPSVSYGIGSVFNISQFNLGIFLGIDSALGENGSKWNFHNKLWLGFGFGYKIAFFGKQE